jgi:hypothetical protein
MSAESERKQLEWQVARDRVLLYMRALDLPPFGGIELALESLKRSGPASVAESMRTLRELLHEQELDRGIVDEEGAFISSLPPLNRGTMVPRKFDRSPWRTALSRFVRRWLRDLFVSDARK